MTAPVQSLSKQEYTAVVFCAVGAEKIISNELKKIFLPANSPADESGTKTFAILESGFGGKVRFKTGLEGLYRAIMSLRAADRLLLEAGIFPALDFDALFEGTRQIPWEDFIPRNMGLRVAKVRSSNSRLKAETSIQAVVHKAAAERLCTKYGLNRLPEQESSAGQKIKQAELRVHIEKDKVSVLLDLSGDPLYKRGYRPVGGIAPLRESTAAAIILLSGWRRKFPLWDPFCGSGTIVIEAALYAWNQAPGLGRSFTFSMLPFGNKDTEDAIRRELAEKIDYTRPICIMGSDTDDKAVSLARENLRNALSLPGKMLKRSGEKGSVGVSIQNLPMERAPVHSVPEGFIITNPPYGRRMGESGEAEKRYRDMAVLGQTFPGWKMALICDHIGFESHFGRKADSCRELKCGAVDTWLYQYEKL
ncbi:MAG: class I SAM-dependent RNA methyltransferase [Treponema sp.]|jgi:putative N6-adenine-specific DNA methylase|nr:class I SAM-dependent RNA methyltransferase [Treponema sp.]